MKKRERFRYEMFIRVIRFVQDNAADFASGVVAAQLAVLIAVVERLQALTGDQSAGLGDARFEFNSKETARENLREMLSEMARTARSMVYEFPGIDLKFRMTRGDNDAALLGKARAFLLEATPIAADFIAYNMDSRFLSELQILD